MGSAPWSIALLQMYRNSFARPRDCRKDREARTVWSSFLTSETDGSRTGTTESNVCSSIWRESAVRNRAYFLLNKALAWFSHRYSLSVAAYRLILLGELTS